VTRLVARSLGGYFRIVHFLLFVCLPVYLLAGTHYDRLIGWSIDQCRCLY